MHTHYTDEKDHMTERLQKALEEKRKTRKSMDIDNANAMDIDNPNDTNI